MEAALKPAAPSAVTVVITSCNQGALIREAVESALAQTIRPDCVSSSMMVPTIRPPSQCLMGSPNSVRQDATVPLPPASLRRSSKKHPYINSRPAHLQDGTIHLLGARLKMSIVVKPKAVIS